MSDWRKAIFFTLCIKRIDRWTPKIKFKLNETLQSSLEQQNENK